MAQQNIVGFKRGNSIRVKKEPREERQGRTMESDDREQREKKTQKSKAIEEDTILERELWRGKGWGRERNERKEIAG